MSHVSPDAVPAPVQSYRFDGSELTCQCCGATTPLRTKARHHSGCKAAAGLAGLTKREREIALLIGRGAVTKEVAVALGIAPKTVEAHKWKIFMFLGIHRTAELVKMVTILDYERELLEKTATSDTVSAASS